MSALGLIAKGLLARLRSSRGQLPGLCFDGFGRKLAFKRLLADRRFSPPIVQGLANPVSCVRYFEFSFADSVILQHEKLQEKNKVLDISSPRLWPLWLSEKRNKQVIMVNPDELDLQISHQTSAFLKHPERVRTIRAADATALPFDDNSFDLVTSISVVEHLNGDGDLAMMSEVARVTKPGGLVVLSFPVKPQFEIEYRAADPYGTQERLDNDCYFFQRFYDKDSIRTRILGDGQYIEINRRYFVENPRAWFHEYEGEWIRRGLDCTVHDPLLMSRHFMDSKNAHPTDRLGICCLALEVG